MSKRQALGVGGVAARLEHRLYFGSGGRGPRFANLGAWGDIRSYHIDVPRHRC